MKERKQPESQPHGDIRQIFDDIFFVTGAFRMASPPLTFSRNMVVLRSGESLTLVNSIRLSENGLKQLDQLGRVENVIRLAGFHGVDDSFYKERYSATVCAVKGQTYTASINPEPTDDDIYFRPDVEVDEHSTLPIPGAALIRIGSCKPPEGLLLLERNGGILISGDALQNWGKTDKYFSFLAKIVMRLKGFIKPYNIGPGWLQTAKPNPAALKKILDVPFDHLLPAHGTEVIGNAKSAYREAIESVQVS